MRSRKLKDRHYTMTKRKRTNNDLQNTTQKTKDWATRTLQTNKKHHNCQKNFFFFFFFKCPNNKKEIYDKYRHTRDRLFGLVIEVIRICKTEGQKTQWPKEWDKRTKLFTKHTHKTKAHSSAMSKGR